MITISAFADEIDPDLNIQMDICEANGVKNIDVRGIDNINCSTMTLAQVAEYSGRLGDRGFGVPCLGSPIGKITMDDDFDAHLDLLKHCCDVAGGFGTRVVRIFSFYASQGKKIADQRSEVMDRIAAMVKVAEQMDAVLLHENEHGIYGEGPDGVKDLLAEIKSERFKGIFDPANYLIDDLRPYDDCWQVGLAELTEAFHVKDVLAEGTVFTPAGEGDGQFVELLADLKARGFAGVMRLDPHLSSGGQFAGFTGPNRFGDAATALKKLCDQAGLEYK